MAWDVFRIHFFADDLHFLDVARRIPLGRLLQGQYGIWPWYRPLSRELFFWLLVHAGPLATPLAHLAGVLVLWVSAVGIWVVARSIASGPAAAIAPVLFVTYQFTKFLTGWASGFQDLLAIALILWAIVMQSRGRRGLALLLAALAPFAKETGFLAGPLVLGWSILCDGERRFRRWMLGHAAVVTAALALHLWVRHRWATGGSAIEIEASAPRLLKGLLQVLGGFVTLPGTLEGVSIALALVGAMAVWALVRPRSESGDAPASRPGAGATGFLLLAAAAGLAPMVVGHLFTLTLPYAYHAFPAIPWIALLAARLARRAPAMLVKAGLSALVIVNGAGLAFHAPNPDNQAFWDFRTWNWFEAVRLSEVNHFLAREDAGPEAFLRELSAAGFGDSSGTAPATLAAEMFRDEPRLEPVYARVLRRPLTAGGHAALAESLLAQGIMVDGGVALRIATTLDPTRTADRLTLGELLAGQGDAAGARVELQAVARSGAPDLAARARDALARLGRPDH